MYVVNAGSFVKASEKACITSSALRHSMSELESELGCKLMCRHKNSIRLTEFGKKFYEDLIPFFIEGNDLYNRIAFSKNMHQKITVFVDGFYCTNVMNELKSLLVNCDNELSFYQKEHVGYKSLLDNECDIVISTCGGNEVDPPEKIYEVSLMQESLGFLVSKATLKKYKDISELLKGEVFLQSSSTLSHPLFKSLEKKIKDNGFDCNAIGVPDILHVLNGVSNGTGISLIEEGIIKIETINFEDMVFIHEPLPFAMTSCKNIAFRKSDFERLGGIISSLKINDDNTN